MFFITIYNEDSVRRNFAMQNFGQLSYFKMTKCWLKMTFILCFFSAIDFLKISEDSVLNTDRHEFQYEIWEVVSSCSIKLLKIKKKRSKPNKTLFFQSIICYPCFCKKEISLSIPIHQFSWSSCFNFDWSKFYLLDLNNILSYKIATIMSSFNPEFPIGFA